VRLVISLFTTPCVIMTGCLKDGDIARIAQKVNPGWSRVSARVLVPGRVRVGDSVNLLEPTAEHDGAA
jgi:MOSC domain-containing protein YiiM